MHEQNGWTLIAHGGAKDTASKDEQKNLDGLSEAVEVGRQLLEQGGSALDAVEAVVKILENNPTYNAGFNGSVVNEAGKVELSASIMDGQTLDIGAVAGVTQVEHPVSAARAMLKDKSIFLIAEGATKFAKEHGLLTTAKPIPATPTASCDTVGCVARDRQGNLAAATSTGGLSGVRIGRVGDVPLPGCGFYADNLRGAVSCSGEGEAIARVLLASEFLHLLHSRSANEAAEDAIKLMNKVQGEAGLIGISPEGYPTWAHNSQSFIVGMAWEESPEPKAYLRKGADDA